MDVEYGHAQRRIMSKSTVAFFLTLLLIVVLIARHNTRSKSETPRPVAENRPVSPLIPAPVSSPGAASPTVAVSTPAQPAKEVDFAKIADQVHPAVVLISVFEPSGKLLKTGTGFFVSDDGKIVTSRSVMEGGAHAVATLNNGHIANINGIVADSDTLDLVVLKSEAKERIPYVSPQKATDADEGRKIGVIGSPFSKVKPAYYERAISKRRADPSGDLLELSMALPPHAIGSPVVNERGEVIGVVTRGPGNLPMAVHMSAAIQTIVAQVNPEGKGKWFVSGATAESLASPAEGPPKVPLAGKPGPIKSRLLYSPTPDYPSAARSSGNMVKGNGRFRVTFGTNGEVRSVSIAQSTRNGVLDQAAVEALRRWKAVPGQEWTLSVPITFRP